MEWKRPSSVPFPTIWHTFQAKDCTGNSLVNYRVQDLPEDRYEDAVEYLVKYFLHLEPLCAKLDMINCSDSVAESRSSWRKLIQQKMTIACFKEGCNELIGVNVLAVMERNAKVDKGIAEKWRKMLAAIKHIGSSVNIYDKYEVDYCLLSFGLTLQPKYIGRGIARHMLEARAPLGRAVGVYLTATVFTNIASQIAAAKAGFELDVECTEEELLANGLDFSGIRTIKLMSRKLN